MLAGMHGLDSMCYARTCPTRGSNGIRVSARDCKRCSSESQALDSVRYVTPFGLDGGPDMALSLSHRQRSTASKTSETLTR